jgi:hypothetical protein
MRFLIPDHSGHRTEEFDTATPEELARAQKLFDELVHGEKKTAYVKREGTSHISRDFDPTANETVFFSQLAGG